jgi:hypothetical protein
MHILLGFHNFDLVIFQYGVKIQYDSSFITVLSSRVTFVGPKYFKNRSGINPSPFENSDSKLNSG